MNPFDAMRFAGKKKGPVTRVAALTALTFASAAGQTSLSTSGLTIVAGDFLIVAFNINASGVNEICTGISGNNSGAGTIVADLFGNDTLKTNLFVGLLKQGATADTTITVSWSSGTTFSGNAHILQYRGVDQTTPQDVAATTATGLNGDLTNPAAITPVTAGAKIIFLGGTGSASATADETGPTNMSNYAEVRGGGTRTQSADASWTTGAFDPVACSGGNSNTTSDSWAACTMALRPG